MHIRRYLYASHYGPPFWVWGVFTKRDSRAPFIMAADLGVALRGAKRHYDIRKRRSSR